MITTFTPVKMQEKVLSLPDDALVLEEFYSSSSSSVGPLIVHRKCIKPKKLWLSSSGINYRTDRQRYFNCYKVIPYDGVSSI